MNSQKTVLITGASSGLGAEFARQYAAQGYQLILVARRLDRLQALIDTLQTQHSQSMWAIACDLSEVGAVAELMDEIAGEELSIDILVNNAGYSPKEGFTEQSLLVVQAQLQVMVNALTELCHAVLPHMQAQGFGRIINVSSLAAFAPPGRGTMYSAIKQYGLSFSQSLDMAVKPHGIHVTALCPGFTHTEFHETMQVSEQAAKIPNFLWGDVEEVVRAAIAAVESGKPVITPKVVNQIIAAFSKRMPEAVRYQMGKLNFLE
ncbi:MAG: SDR family oxidoreductase [Pseudomonadota bacterium]|nr:SDR family oxidoreductase [Pseudomonadota bacterium]